METPVRQNKHSVIILCLYTEKSTVEVGTRHFIIILTSGDYFAIPGGRSEGLFRIKWDILLSSAESLGDTGTYFLKASGHVMYVATVATKFEIIRLSISKQLTRPKSELCKWKPVVIFWTTMGNHFVRITVRCLIRYNYKYDVSVSIMNAPPTNTEQTAVGSQ